MGKWSDEEILFVKENYLSMTYKEIGGILNRPRSGVRYVVKEHLGLKKGSGAFIPPVNKKKVDSDYFKDFTEESCYILGFLVADGHVERKRYRFSVGLAKKDIDRLDFIKKELDSEVKIKHYDKTKSVKLSIGCKQLHTDLINLGFGELKKNIDSIFDKIPKDRHRDFIRGFFDGDGCCSVWSRTRVIKGRTYKNLEKKVSFTNNSLPLLTRVQREIGMGAIVDCKKWGSWYVLQFGNMDDIKDFSDYIYKDVKNEETIMKRKQNKFKQILGDKF